MVTASTLGIDGVIKQNTPIIYLKQFRLLTQLLQCLVHEEAHAPALSGGILGITTWTEAVAVLNINMVQTFGVPFKSSTLVFPWCHP